MEKPTHTPNGVCSSSLEQEQNAVVERLRASGALSAQSLPRIVDLVTRFCSFCERASGLGSLADASALEAAAFVHAPTAEGEPAPATMHLRRSALRLLFRSAREVGLANSDPTLDLVLPPRSSLRTRPLTDDEIALCRAASLHTLMSTRLPAAWALAEAPVVYNGERGSDYHRQAASCVAITDTLHRAGLSDEPDVRPLSVVAWAGRQVLDETDRIDEVAHRLGIRSLDRAAALIGWDWQTDLEDGE